MSAKNTTDVVLAFVEKINAHDVDGLINLMAEDHVLVDSLDNIVRGREKMRKAWEAYFRWFPDYQISIKEIFQNDDAVALLGTARGTYCVDGKLLEKNEWEIPAAWKAVVKNNRLVEWRVYADNSPVMRIMEAINQ
jgi:uncharacterized protein (TIGR02246 family)